MDALSIVLPFVASVSMEEIIACSFRDYHVKGFDYICLRRSHAQTVKLYFFDGDVSKLPEVVNPHDHRYDFNTLCVAGSVQNTWFTEDPSGETFQRFAYDTPLMGGKGFTWDGETKMGVMHRSHTEAGRRYWMNYDEVHTIRLMENETVLCIVQHEDRVTDHPTLTFTRDREPPSLAGLYNQFTADQVRERMRKLQQRVPSLRLPAIT